MVANQTTLKEISTYLPLTKKDLLLISGFGKAKVDKYGDDIIDAVDSYCNRNGVGTNMLTKLENPKRERKEKTKEAKPDTKKVSFDLFKTGKTIAEIAKERNFTQTTIEGHLAHYVEIGDLDINTLVSKETQHIIKAALAKYGNDSLTIIKQNVPEDISFGAIRLVGADVKRMERG